MRLRLDVWEISIRAVSRRTTCVTALREFHRQTGHVLTPTAAPDGESGHVPVRQRRPQQPLGDFVPQRRASPGDVRGGSGGVDWRAGMVSSTDARSRSSGRRETPASTSACGSSARGRQQSAKARDVGTRHCVVARRQVIYSTMPTMPPGRVEESGPFRRPGGHRADQRSGRET